MWANQAGRAEFRTQSDRVKVWDIIGRSMVVHDMVASSSNEKRYARIW